MDSRSLSSIARAAVEFARRNGLKLMLVADQLAFDEHLWREASPQMLNALCSCEPEITAWLSGEPTQRDGGASDDESHLPDANRRQNGAKNDGTQKPSAWQLEL
jgi:hypothetical protein